MNSWLTCSIPEPFSFVYASDTVFCSSPPVSKPQDDALLQEAMGVLWDHDSFSCMELFPFGRSIFQFSIDFFPQTTASLSVWFSGVGIHCEDLVTVYLERATNDCLLPGKKECAFAEQTTTPDNMECVYRCNVLIALGDGVTVTFRTQSTKWASEPHKLSQLCDFIITPD